jgi:hypothetical protein
VFQPKFVGIKSYVVFCDFDRSVRAAVIYENIFPVVVSLPEYTFDTLGQVVLGIVERSHNADERGFGIHAGAVLHYEVILTGGFSADFVISRPTNSECVEQRDMINECPVVGLETGFEKALADRKRRDVYRFTATKKRDWPKPALSFNRFTRSAPNTALL